MTKLRRTVVFINCGCSQEQLAGLCQKLGVECDSTTSESLPLDRKRRISNRKSGEIWIKYGFGVWGSLGAHFHCELELKNGSKARWNYSASSWTNNFWFSIPEIRKPTHFVIIRPSGRDHVSRNQLDKSIYFKHTKTHSESFLHNITWAISTSLIFCLDNVPMHP